LSRARSKRHRTQATLSNPKAKGQSHPFNTPSKSIKTIQFAAKMMAKPWNEYQGTITKLYIKEGRTLKDVRNIMKLKYNFDAS
jgi:hypothetical protein